MQPAAPIWDVIAPFMAPGLCVGGLVLVVAVCLWDYRSRGLTY